MNQAQAAGQHHGKPSPRNTGQYTISVSKPGVGEDHELRRNQFKLTVLFIPSEEREHPIPDACRIDVRRGGIYQGFDQDFAFADCHNGSYVADVVMTLDESWQETWWIDIYLVTGDRQEYAVSAYLSTLLVDHMTVACTYHSLPQTNRRDG